MFLSTVAIRLFALGLRSLLDTSFSRARTTPSLHRIPIAVPPFSTAFRAYSTYMDEHDYAKESGIEMYLKVAAIGRED
jgi:hypothetical protein